MRHTIGLTLAGALLMTASTGFAELKKGDAVPKFTAKDETGKDWKSEDHIGKKVVVVYFYPADFTGGCTKQACGFRDDLDELSKQGIEVVGVSGDSVETHAAFKKYHKLNFPLLADEEAKLAEIFGVEHEKGKKTVEFDVDGNGKKVPFTRGATIKRWTYLIGKDGKIASVYKVEDAQGDSKTILKLAKELK